MIGWKNFSSQAGPDTTICEDILWYCFRSISICISLFIQSIEGKYLLLCDCSLLDLMAECCVVMRNFTPDLCLLLNDITFDATSYDKQVEYGFTHPSLDIKSAPSFGSLISAMMYCVSSLSSVS